MLLALSQEPLQAGLLGIGGGVIIVPVLSLVFIGEGVDPDILIKVAIGTSLATISITSISSILAHHRAGAVSWGLMKTMTPGIIVGSLINTGFGDLYKCQKR